MQIYIFVLFNLKKYPYLVYILNLSVLENIYFIIWLHILVSNGWLRVNCIPVFMVRGGGRASHRKNIVSLLYDGLCVMGLHGLKRTLVRFEALVPWESNFSDIQSICVDISSTPVLAWMSLFLAYLPSDRTPLRILWTTGLPSLGIRKKGPDRGRPPCSSFI